MPEREPFDYRNLDCLSQDFFCILDGVSKVVCRISYMREVSQNDCLLLFVELPLELIEVNFFRFCRQVQPNPPETKLLPQYRENTVSLEPRQGRINFLPKECLKPLNLQHLFQTQWHIVLKIKPSEKIQY